jgi:glycerol-1-phosphate dehydrogenase [NAD(P)+]
VTDPIAEVLAGQFQAPELGGPLRTTIRRIALEDTTEGQEQALLAGLGLGDRLGVVADENTVEVLGRRVHRALPGAELVVLDHPKADEAGADALQDRTRNLDGLVAIGSGTVNDLCKYVTHRSGRRSAVFGTAPSMDGYVTNTVSITRNGFKLSLPAHAPVGVFLDLGVMARAPRRMILAGLGDTLCRSTAQVDWLLSHLLLDARYAETPYVLMQDEEPHLLAAAGRLADGDKDAVRLLTRLLVLSGLGVLVTGTSHCGSMGEHQISHYIDMLASPHPGTLHGEQVGVATWTMARLQTRMLAGTTPPVLHPIGPDRSFASRFGRFAPACEEAMARKPFDASGTERLNARLAERWRAIRAALLKVMLPLAEMERVIAASGMLATGEGLGLTRAFYSEAVGHAHEIRDRYCFLDLAAQAGVLAEFAAAET